MSMTSAQIDELRRYADRADGTFPMLASALRDAADTIGELRDDLQRANGRLADAEHDESRAWDRVHKAEAEADRLRELASELWVSCPVHDSDCDECQYKGGRTGCELYDRMRELGVDG